MARPTPDFPAPVFIGGSARSGTHAMGRMLTVHPRYHLIPVEARFHAGRRGLTEVLERGLDIDAYCERVLGEWWLRGLKADRGLVTIIERPELERATARLRSGWESDPWEAARRFIGEVLDPVAERAGKPTWVDLSGRNISQAPVLARLFERARFIHMVRDGRAVTAAILQKIETTDDREEAFGHWVARVRRSNLALQAMPPGAVLTIDLEEFAAHDRERQFERLISYLEVDDPSPLRDYFDREITAERANVGAWRQRLSPADARWVDRKYRRMVRELRREGADWAPAP
jgi:Sulfotransferase family